MAMFFVPGWDVPTTPRTLDSGSSRKRKRPVSSESTSNRLQAAELNLEKLVKKLGNDGLSSVREKAKIKTENPALARQEGKGSGRIESSHEQPTSSRRAKSTKSKNPVKGVASTGGIRMETLELSADFKTGSSEAKLHVSKQKKMRRKESQALNAKSTEHAEDENVRLTSLQTKMKQSLGGARFRWINETLYKSNSEDAKRLMRGDSKIFDDYHMGFRHQVTSWPSNPVDHYIETLSSYPAHTVIIDLGCGDAALARALIPKGFTVFSYDLVSPNPYVVATDICSSLPLPGAEDRDEGQIVDIAVCSLSLMSTNWLDCIREVRRVLKTGGELKVAEVSSRFTDIDDFASLVSSVGFRLVAKDDENTHFTLFDFKKTSKQRNLEGEVWEKISDRGSVLQPCEYRRR